MRQLIRRLAKMVIGYGAIVWAGPFLSLIFTPIITRILTPSDYGIADYALTVSSAVSAIALFAQPQALTAHFNDREDDIWKSKITGSALVNILFIGIPLSVGVFFSAESISRWAFHDTSYQDLFRIIGLTICFGATSSVMVTAAQVAMRVRWGMVLSASSIVATVVCNIIFIVLLRWGAMGMVLTSSVTAIITGSLGIVLMRHKISLPTMNFVRLMLGSGAKLLPTMLAYWVLLLLDRLFLVQFISSESLGHYAIANRIASLMTIVMNPITQAWTPIALASHGEKNAEDRFVAMARYLISLVLIAALFLGLFATEILTILTRPSYLPAAPYVGFLAYIYVNSTFSSILITGAMINKQLGAISFAVVAGALVNIALNFLLIPTYKIWGAITATVIGFSVPQILLYFWLNARYPINYPIKKILLILFVQIALVAINSSLPPMNFYMRIAIKITFMFAFAFALVKTQMITSFELNQLVSFVKNQWQIRIASRFELHE